MIICPVQGAGLRRPDAYTKLLIRATGEGQGIRDSTGKTVTVNGNTTHSAAYAVFGSKSIYFDGNGDYLTVPDVSDLNLSTGDFTVECYVCSPAWNTQSDIIWFGGRTTSFAGVFLTIIAGKLAFLISINGTTWAINATNLATLSTGVWYNIALVRASGVFTIYVNGISVYTNSSYTGSTLYHGTYNAIGADYFTSRPGWGAYYYGYMSEFHISKVARHTAAYPIPTRRM